MRIVINFGIQIALKKLNDNFFRGKNFLHRGGSMIRVLINFTVHSGNKIELQQAIEGLVAKIEREDGCLGCEIYRKIKNPEEFLLVETWEDAANIRSHVISKNMAALAGAGKILCRRVHVSLAEDELIEELSTTFEKRLLGKG